MFFLAFLEISVFQKYFTTNHSPKSKCNSITRLDKCYSLDTVCQKTRLCSKKLHCSNMSSKATSPVDSTVICLNVSILLS